MPLLSYESTSRRLAAVKILKEDTNCKYVDYYETQHHQDVFHEKTVSQYYSYGSSKSAEADIIEIIGTNPYYIEMESKKLNCTHWDNSFSFNPVPASIPADVVVRKVIDTGDASNRIDVVFMGDGYTLTQKDMFFSDIDRLVKDMWSSTTFAPVIPLFNVWAVFVPSRDQGIGSNGKPKDTAFGLYRDGELQINVTFRNGTSRNLSKLAR